jgi:hypothetical protein
MFSPGGGDDIYVPLGNISWSFSFGARWSSPAISPSLLNPPTGDPSSSTAWPTYKGSFKNPNN